jgi:radical SAM-linked protein
VSWHLLRFSRTGAARYLSHLDTVRALQRTFARAGVAIALSQGMRPKPHLSLVLPLPVGAAGLDELAVVELSDALAPGGSTAGGDRLARLRAAAPEGIGVAALDGATVRPRPVAASADYECDVMGVPDRLARAALWFEEQERVPCERTSPKGTRTIDLRRYVTGLVVRPAEPWSRLGFTVHYEADGAARPEEFVRLLAERAGADPAMRDLVRTRVTYKESRGSIERAHKE